MISSPYSGPIRKFPTGARPTPRHKLAAATPHRVLHAPPDKFGRIPKQLDMWDNDVDGVCVTTEEAFKCACYAIDPEIFIPASTVKAWAAKHGWLNGADLTEVMDAMQQSGFAIGSQLYNGGPYTSVDYTNATVLASALFKGPVKLGIMSSALPSGAGNHNGWYAVGPGPRGPEDHCVGLSCYGTVDWLYSQLTALHPDAIQPTGLNPSQPGYLLFTWNTMGFVDQTWLNAACGEAWVRDPWVIGVPPLPGPTPPPPPPVTTEGLTLASALPAGTWPVGIGTYTNPTQVPAGFYPLNRVQPSPLVADEAAFEAALAKLIGDVPTTAASDIAAVQAAYAKLKADIPVTK